ncbi:hypothetical protein [Thermomonospora cellulosilytica]|uniref:Uncharacterized protein n=1 Tax=Thermomonospora cellulosilytica TaxID=1411118 RepID=A0A7W3MXJ4_9ACTN|nr:hypothetical protein [Thermomonospora cellulosilytica]MBA9003701.1 hypothetical protein [Thermomonospora cellulosilytica]
MTAHDSCPPWCRYQHRKHTRAHFSDQLGNNRASVRIYQLPGRDPHINISPGEFAAFIDFGVCQVSRRQALALLAAVEADPAGLAAALRRAVALVEDHRPVTRFEAAPGAEEPDAVHTVCASRVHPDPEPWPCRDAVDAGLAPAPEPAVFVPDPTAEAPF